MGTRFRSHLLMISCPKCSSGRSGICVHAMPPSPFLGAEIGPPPVDEQASCHEPSVGGQITCFNSVGYSLEAEAGEGSCRVFPTCSVPKNGFAGFVRPRFWRQHAGSHESISSDAAQLA